MSFVRLRITGTSAPLVALGAGLLSIAAVGWLDDVTGPHLGLSLLYLLPVTIVSWHFGRAHGVTLAVAGALAWLLAELSWQHEYSVLVSEWNAFTRLVIFVGFAIMLSQLGTLQRRLEVALAVERHLARTDLLTAVSNRRGFHEAAGTVIARAQAARYPLTVVFVDLDGFKAVNDRLGHEQGDQLLACVGQALSTSARPRDVVARLGGDEFALLLPEMNRRDIEPFLDRLRAAVGDATRTRWEVTASYGAVVFEEPPPDVDAMLRNAERLMYEVKRSGKDGLRIEVATGQGNGPAQD